VAEEHPDFDDTSLEKHSHLTKAESSLLTQLRTEKIGLRTFLFTCKVPEILTPHCACGTGKETVEHLILWCPERPPPPHLPRRRILLSYRDLKNALGDPASAHQIVRWVLSTGRLQEYRLAVSLEEEEWMENPEV
jgi:hypothetical protein